MPPEPNHKARIFSRTYFECANNTTMDMHWICFTIEMEFLVVASFLFFFFFILAKLLLLIYIFERCFSTRAI